MQIKVGIAGGSGYIGGELLRILLLHPHVRITQISSNKHAGKYIKKIHPNLRGITDLKFISLDNLKPCDILFLCLPHKTSMKLIETFISLAPKIIDLSADFRLKDPEIYKYWYGETHLNPALIKKFIYGIPELHRAKIKNAKYISSAGCNATASILGLYPLYKEGIIEEDKTVIEVKVGISEAGKQVNVGSHYPERVRSVRSYKPTNHRHVAEIVQELSNGDLKNIHFSATSIDIVRGVLATSHVFLRDEFAYFKEKDIWKIYRNYYGKEPFIRIIKEKTGNYRYPDPKTLTASNFCDIGFEKDKQSNRIVVISAIDNLMKGAAGQAVQAFNIMYGLEENCGLEFPGIHLY